MNNTCIFAELKLKDMTKVEKLEEEIDIMQTIIEDLDNTIGHCECEDGVIRIRASDNDPCKDNYKDCKSCLPARIEREALLVKLAESVEKLEEEKLFI